MFSSFLPKLFLSSLSVVLLGVIYTVITSPDDAISLQPPPFMAQAAQAQTDNPATFLQTEAGISAYVKTNEAIRLDLIKSAFTIIEDQTADYIIGSAAYDTHMYVHKDGWIVVYYFAADPIGKIIEVPAKTTTKLETVVSQTAVKGNLTYDAIKFYHFKYPNATKMKFITKANGAFEITLPTNIEVYERGWGIQCNVSFYCYTSESVLSINAQVISTTRTTAFGSLTAQQLVTDYKNIVSITQQTNTSPDYAHLTLILLYRDTP